MAFRPQLSNLLLLCVVAVYLPMRLEMLARALYQVVSIESAMRGGEGDSSGNGKYVDNGEGTKATEAPRFGRAKLIRKSFGEKIIITRSSDTARRRAGTDFVGTLRLQSVGLPTLFSIPNFCFSQYLQPYGPCQMGPLTLAPRSERLR